MFIPQETIDEVIARADIADVIGKHLKLKKSGHNYFVNCPFHNEKSASFSVNPSKQMYHCFGCGESGNVISFVIKYIGLDFVAAVKSLADEYNIRIPEDKQNINFTPQQLKQKKQDKLNLNQTILKTVAYYQKKLVESAVANNYLKKRGLTEEICKLFQLGYSPNNYANLAQVFDDYQTNKFLIDAGITVKTKNGKLYDRFRDRIMFPIRNIKGDIIGFGGRIIDDGQPKYLNSPETQLFNKSLELYGLFEAKQVIRDLNQVIIVEGYMDVIALYQYGIKNVVATMGTALTQEHIKVLFRLCDNICYAFDGDNAGKRAAWRALERSISLITDNKAVNFLFLPDEHDPDSYVRKFGTENFMKVCQNSTVGLINYLLNHTLTEVNINTDEGKAKFINLIKPYIERINAVALQVILKKQLSAIVDLEPSVVESILNNRSRYAFYNKRFNKIDSKLAAKPLVPHKANLIKNIIMLLFRQPTLSRYYHPPIAEMANYNIDIQNLFRLICYFDVHCDNFQDIDLSKIANVVQFEEINLHGIWQELIHEQANYTNKNLKTEQEFIETINKLLNPKRNFLSLNKNNN